MPIRNGFLLLLLAGFWAGTAIAQTPCAGPDLGELARAAGRFDHAAALSPETDADRIAALEQQSWREFRWQVLTAGCVRLELSVDSGAAPKGWPAGLAIPPDAARGSLHVSADGEVFRPLADGGAVAEGESLSVLISQMVEPLPDGHQRFFPASWQFALFGQAAADAGGPLLAPAEFGSALGCRETGCGEKAVEAATVAVSDSPDPATGAEPSAAESAPADDSGDGSLAAELQSELARVGCYLAAIDGLWGPASRRAMRNFNHWAGKDAEIDTATAKALVTVARTPAPVCGVD